MSDDKMRKKWDLFVGRNIKYLRSEETIKNDKIEKCKEYINKHNKIPSAHDKEPEIKSLGIWISKVRNNETLLNKSEYKEFFDEYSDYFLTPEEKWNKNFELLKEYVNEHEKFPSGANKDDSIRYLGKWAGTQKRIFKTKTQIMANENIYDTWRIFFEDNSKLFE